MPFGLEWSFFTSLFQVIMIDLVLAGDNAVVIGLAAAGLASDLRRKAILIGIIAATVLRIFFALITTQLLQLGGALLIAGAALLLYVCWKMYRELRTMTYESIAPSSDIAELEDSSFEPAKRAGGYAYLIGVLAGLFVGIVSAILFRPSMGGQQPSIALSLQAIFGLGGSNLGYGGQFLATLLVFASVGLVVGLVTGYAIERIASASDPTVPKAPEYGGINADGTIAGKAARKTLRQSVLQIIIADVSMSLDNVLAVAGAAQHHIEALIFGLALSVVMMGVAASFIAGLLNRMRWIAWVGLLIIFYVALKMGYEGADQVLGGTLPHIPFVYGGHVAPPA